MNIEKIKQILVGIDKTETESINGWWPASYGAEFGEQVLKNLIDYIAPFTEELEKLRAENSYCKRLALDIASQKAVGEVTEINGVLGAVFYKGSELECGETIYAKPVSLLRNLEQSDTNVVATQLLEALQDMVDMYVSLVDSGDCGKWNPENDREVIKARAAIKAATDSDSLDKNLAPVFYDEPAKHAPEESDKNLCALKTITDLQVKQVVRAFWRRIYPYRNGYERELPDQLPTEFFAHMATALSWVDKPLPHTDPTSTTIDNNLSILHKYSDELVKWIIEHKLVDSQNENVLACAVSLAFKNCFYEIDADSEPIDALIEDLNAPDDWENPRWEVENRVNNWRNYAGEFVKREWNSFTIHQKILIASMLYDVALQEKWN